MTNLLIYLEYFLSLLIFIILTRILDFTPVEYKQLEKLDEIEKDLSELRVNIMKKLEIIHKEIKK